MNQTQGDTAEIIAEEYWGKKGDVDLFIFRKRLAAPSDTPRPVLFLFHGSSFSARTSYDLEVPGHGEYSLMNVFARYGFDVWTMDHEGYGRSTHTDGYSYIADGVEDLKVAMPIMEEATGQKTCSFFGSSSGALRAGAFANACPERVAAFSRAMWSASQFPNCRQRPRRPKWRMAAAASPMAPISTCAQTCRSSIR